ncbi:MAG: hypothetical protein WAV04_01545 [Candidatus Microsaccharimonas sp.]
MSKKAKGIVAAIAAVVVVGILLVPFAFQATDSSNTPSGTVAFDPETDLVPDDARCTDNHFIDSSLQTVKVGNSEYRQFATAVSIPVAGSDDEAVNKEVTMEVCGNPTFLRMIADDMMLWTVKGAEGNKAWIQVILDDINTNGLDSFVEKTENDVLIVTPQFQKYAGWLNAVLLRFTTEGKQSLTSIRNWEVPADASPITLPTARLASEQESKPAWVRTLLDKNGNCLFRIGFNAEDKRLEVFECEGTPAQPGCTENCSEVPPCTTNCGPPPCTVNCDAKNQIDSVDEPPFVAPKGIDAPEHTPPVAPAVPLNPATPPHSDPVPVPAPAPDPVIAPPPTQAPTTPIADPDA